MILVVFSYFNDSTTANPMQKSHCSISRNPTAANVHVHKVPYPCLHLSSQTSGSWMPFPFQLAFQSHTREATCKTEKEKGSAALQRNEAPSLPHCRSERPMPRCPPSTPPYPAVLAKLHVCAGIRATGTKVYKSRDPLSARLRRAVPKPYPQITASSRPAPARADSSPRRGPAIGLSNGSPMESLMGCKGLLRAGLRARRRHA